MARSPNLDDDLDSLLDRALRGEGEIDESLRALGTGIAVITTTDTATGASTTFQISNAP